MSLENNTFEEYLASARKKVAEFDARSSDLDKKFAYMKSEDISDLSMVRDNVIELDMLQFQISSEYSAALNMRDDFDVTKERFKWYARALKQPSFEHGYARATRLTLFAVEFPSTIKTVHELCRKLQNGTEQEFKKYIEIDHFFRLQAYVMADQFEKQGRIDDARELRAEAGNPGLFK